MHVCVHMPCAAPCARLSTHSHLHLDVHRTKLIALVQANMADRALVVQRLSQAVAAMAVLSGPDQAAHLALEAVHSSSTVRQLLGARNLP
jgi:hypothetical protein